MHLVVFYEIRPLYMRVDFLSQKDIKALFETDINDRKNTLNVYSTVFFIHKLFLSGQRHSFKSAIN